MLKSVVRLLLEDCDPTISVELKIRLTPFKRRNIATLGLSASFAAKCESNECSLGTGIQSEMFEVCITSQCFSVLLVKSQKFP